MGGNKFYFNYFLEFMNIILPYLKQHKDKELVKFILQHFYLNNDVLEQEEGKMFKLIEEDK